MTEYVWEIKTAHIEHYVDNDTRFSVISAYTDQEEVKNEGEHLVLKQAIIKAGFGYAVIKAGYYDVPETTENKTIKEEKAFIILQTESEENDESLFHFSIEQASKYNQRAFLYKSKTKNKIQLFSNTGELETSWDDIKFNNNSEFASWIYKSKISLFQREYQKVAFYKQASVFEAKALHDRRLRELNKQQSK